MGSEGRDIISACTVKAVGAWDLRIGKADVCVGRAGILVVSSEEDSALRDKDSEATDMGIGRSE